MTGGELDHPRPRSSASDDGRGRGASATCPNTLAIFDSHFPRFPVLPGVLMLGSLGALCGELLEKRDGQALAAAPAPTASASGTSCSRATSWC